MEDKELIELKKQWTKKWDGYVGSISRKQKDNEEYWMGKQFSTSEEKRPLVDNLIFESLETFLPLATRAKADPLVESQDEGAGTEVAERVRKMLYYTADRISFSLKMKQVTRFWALYLLGVVKVGWSMESNDIDAHVVLPQKLILDPDATIEECEYNGYYIGEETSDIASDLIERFPEKKKFIEDKVKGKMGTSVKYVQWWTDDYIFWTLEDEVLDKKRNPHWNYSSQQPIPVDENGQQPMDESGQPQTQEVEGKNHFNSRKKPYIFLSVFNLGKHPHDDTNLIQQNLSLQDLINKRLAQIDMNADNANSGLIVSGDAFTEEQANKIGKSLRKRGAVVWVPTGDVNTSVKRDVGSPLPPFVYQSLIDYRGEMRDLFGMRGSSPQGLSGEKTVRGKMFMQQQDQSRIGGGIAAYLEEFADITYNWFVQLMYVYYDEPHVAVVLGKDKAREYVTLTNTDFTSKLLVGVKEGSMIPQDPMSKRNEALQLWGEKGIDPITFFDRLEFPNPKEAAKQLYLWLSDPVQLFPELAQQQQGAKEKPPSESINFKDLPIEGQVQMAAKAGIQLHPDQVASHVVAEHALKNQPKPGAVPSPVDYQNLMLNQ